MEDARKRHRVEIVFEYETYVYEQPEFVSFGVERYESEGVDLFFEFKHKERNLTFKRPFYLGFVFVETKKLHMFELTKIYFSPVVVKIN